MPDPLAEGGTFVTRSPVLLRPNPGGFDLLDHEGATSLRLDIDTLLVASAFRTPQGFTEANASLLAHPDTSSLPPAEIEKALRNLIAVGLVSKFDFDSSAQGRKDREDQAARESMIRFNEAMRATLTISDGQF